MKLFRVTLIFMAFEFIWFLWIGIIWRDQEPDNTIWVQMQGLRNLVTLVKVALFGGKLAIAIALYKLRDKE
jgi:hypothetical protein